MMTQSNVHHFCNFYIFLSVFHSLTIEPHPNLFTTARMSILSQSPPVSWRMVRVPVIHDPLLMSFSRRRKMWLQKVIPISRYENSGRGVLMVLSIMAPREQGSNATSRSFINDAQRTSPCNSCCIMQTMTPNAADASYTSETSLNVNGSAEQI